MAQIDITSAVAQVLGVLDEAFVHPDKPFSYFTDNAPDSGVFGLTDTLSASDASRVSEGTSIASHIRHLCFGLEASADWVLGTRNPRDWEDAWQDNVVDEATWAGLKEELRAAYERLREAIKLEAAESVEAFGGALGAVAHAAYHLSAIRQKAARR